MFGSLVIVFPTQHTGGALTLRHKNDMDPFTFDAGTILADSSPRLSLNCLCRILQRRRTMRSHL